MIYDTGTPGNGVWHCPFTKSWVERMKRAAKHCESLSAEYIERKLNDDSLSFTLPPGDFLSEPQDARGLPLSWQRKGKRCVYPKCSIYDYWSVPEVVVTNGEDDWPLRYRFNVLSA